MRRFIVYILVLGILFALVQTFFAERAVAPSGRKDSSASSDAAVTDADSRSSECNDLTLVFYSKSDFQNAEFLHPVSVHRCMSTRTNIVHVALKQLFAGPTDEEKSQGALASADLQTLGTYYLGVSVEEGIATVNFKKDALLILNGAAARQMMAKAPIEATLRHMSDITEVRYAIDGKVWTEWDA